MKRSPLDLAAVATAAVPGLRAQQVGWLPDDREDFDSALVIDANGARWRVRSPKHADASLRLETELRALGGLSPAVRGALPFAVPSVAGTVRRGELKTFVYHHLDGHALGLDELSAPGSTLPAQIGRAIAAVHASDRETLERAGLPADDAEEYRRARLSELDQVAASGRVPAALLRRWEAAMEDVSLWRFNPSVVHGDLHEEQLFVHEGKLVAVTGWSDLHVGDPATDLAWLLALEDQRVIDAVVEAYSSWRGDKADPHLMTRATLAAEFALARWLARAITRGDAARVAEAEALLTELDQNLRELGDKPIGLVEAAPSAPSPSSTGSSAAPAAVAAVSAGAAVTELPAESAPSDSKTVQDAAPDATPAAEAQAELKTDSKDEAPEPDSATEDKKATTELPAESSETSDAAEDQDSAQASEAQAEDKSAFAGADASAEAPSGADAESDSEAADEDDENDENDDAVITDADVPEPATEAIAVIAPEQGKTGK